MNEQLRSGAITEEDARNSRFKNIITRSVGFEREVLVDLLGLELEAGDAIVVCCDGLSNLVEDQEILALGGGARATRPSERLVDLANERGGDDNITVAMIRLIDPNRSQGRRRRVTAPRRGPSWARPLP